MIPNRDTLADDAEMSMWADLVRTLATIILGVAALMLIVAWLIDQGLGAWLLGCMVGVPVLGFAVIALNTWRRRRAN